MTVNDGFLSVAGAIGLVNRDVTLNGPGIKINTPLNPTSITTVRAAGATQRSLDTDSDLGH